MFRTIRNAQGQHTARPQSTDREREATRHEAEPGYSGWLGRKLSRQAAPERDAASMLTSDVMDISGGRSLAQRAVQAVREAAQPAPADKILREALVSKELPLQLWLPEQLLNGKINFDCVKRGRFYCLVEGKTFQAYYLGKNYYGRTTIEIPLKPGNGEPRYLLTPSLRDDFVGIVLHGKCIRVWRDKNYRPDPEQDCLFMPQGRSVRQNSRSFLKYQSFSGDVYKGGDSREKPKGYENVFWGQFSRSDIESERPQWLFNCQNFIPPDRINIIEASLTGGAPSIVFYLSCRKTMIIRDAIHSTNYPLSLMLDLPSAQGKISFDIITREDRCYLKQGSQYQAYYLGEIESGRNTIELPLQPCAGAPRYFLTPPLHGDVVGVAICDDRIEVFREKLDLKKATTKNKSSARKLIVQKNSSLFIPDDTEYRQNTQGEVFLYHCDPELGLTRDNARIAPNAPDVLFWGQYERRSMSRGDEWFFGLQEHCPDGLTRIHDIVNRDGEYKAGSYTIIEK